MKRSLRRRTPGIAGPIHRISAADSARFSTHPPAWKDGGEGERFVTPLSASTRPRRVVVDASVVAKWFLPEPDAQAARRLVTGDYDVVVPDLVFSELGGILQHRVSLAEIDDYEALSVLQLLERMPLQIHRTWPLGPIALELRRSLDLCMNDCIHIALALRETAIFVTADRSLLEVINRTLLARHVLWIADIPHLTQPADATG